MVQDYSLKHIFPPIVCLTDTPVLPIRIKTMAKKAKTMAKKAIVEPTEQAIEAPVSDEIIEVDEVVVDEKIDAVIEDSEVEESTDESPEKKAFRAKVEAYKLSNPIKYEMKKEHFESTLKGMK